MSDEASTFPMILAGRKVMFRRPLLGQVLMLQRLYVKRINSASQLPDAEQRLELSSSAMVQVLDFIEALIIDDDDKFFVEQKMLAGQIDFPDLAQALSGGDQEEQGEDDQPPPNRAAKRAAKPAKKAVAKKTAAKKTVANNARTKR